MQVGTRDDKKCLDSGIFGLRDVGSDRVRSIKGNSKILGRSHWMDGVAMNEGEEKTDCR